jgi:hypothetical protein
MVVMRITEVIFEQPLSREPALARPLGPGGGVGGGPGPLDAAPRLSVYLADPKPLPLHDCENCGLEVPIRPGWQKGDHTEPAKAYFESCPVCGGRVGYCARWHKQHGGG